MSHFNDALRAGVYRAFNRAGFRFLLATGAAGQATLRLRKLCRVRYEDAWIQEFPNGVLVEPRLRLKVLPEIERVVKDTCMYEYLPHAGDVVLDIGAGTGWQTLCFSRMVGGSGRVISVEAHPKTFGCLNRMCELNKLLNVSPIHCAVAAGGGNVLISDDEKHAQNSILNVKRGVSVPSATLDELFRSLRLSRIDLLKMNIEGAERIVLREMTEMIRRTCHVCIACHDFCADSGGPAEMRTKSEVVAFLEQNGFEVITRASDPRAWIRDYVYGRRRGSRCEASR